MTRRPLIAGNWKMHLTHVEAVDLVRKLGAALPDGVHDTATTPRPPRRCASSTAAR